MGKGKWQKWDSSEWYQNQYDYDPLPDEIELTEHQAKNDYQDDGEPYGSLDNRDRDAKEDVTIEDSRHYRIP